jgi:hypothetical protein
LQLCDQDIVNFVVGLWWFLTLFVSLFLLRGLPYQDQKPDDGEKLLVEDHASPVGYKVPDLPDFEIDPALANTGSKCFSLKFEFAVGIIFAFVGGTGLIFLAFSNWDDDLYDQVGDVLRDVV